MMSSYHTPVLLDESVSALSVGENPDGVFVDATFGGGGHSSEILRRMGKNGHLLAFDRDMDAQSNIQKDNRLIFIHNNFRFVSNFVKYHGFEKADGILADLGVSSHQFDTSERGFSFRFDAKLDMRMNTANGKSAADVLNTCSQEELSAIFKNWGEVDNPRKVAALICEYRVNNKIETTVDLNNALERVIPKHSEHKYLAKIYQALRIEVNGEMRSLEMFLISAASILKSGGRLVIITYHSLEDRMVKNFIKSGNINGEISKDLYGNIEVPFINITRKPIVPDEDEISGNTRARSAKLRVAQKI